MVTHLTLFGEVYPPSWRLFYLITMPLTSSQLLILLLLSKRRSMAIVQVMSSSSRPFIILVIYDFSKSTCTSISFRLLILVIILRIGTRGKKNEDKKRDSEIGR